MDKQYVNKEIYEKYKLPYKYEVYEICGNEENIIDYYRLYYLPYCTNNPIIIDVEENYPQIISINRHVHILLNHFNVSCDISQCGDGKTRESIGVLATYFNCLKYMKEFPISFEKINICIFGPANCRKIWETESEMNFDCVGKIKFFSINTIQGNIKNLPSKTFILGGRLENKNIVYFPGKLLKKFKKLGYCFIFDEFHYAKNDCLSSDASIAITNYINKDSIYVKYDYDTINKLKRKISSGKTDKYLPMLDKECFKNKVMFMSASLTDKGDITTILKSLNIIDKRLIFGGRGIGSIKNYDQLKKFIKKSRKFNEEETRKIERRVLNTKRDILLLESEKIQSKFDNKIFSTLVNEIFTYVWIPLLFSHITPIIKSEFEPEIYNSFNKLKYGNKEIIGLSKKLLKDVNNKNMTLKKFGTKIKSLEFATLPILEGMAREVIEQNSNNRVTLAVPEIVMVNILSRLLEDIDHIIITSEITNKNENLKKFQKNKSNSPKIIIATIKSIYQSINLSDNDGNYVRYLFAIPTYSIIESYQLIGRFFKRYTTKSKPIIKFVYIISEDVKEFDKDKLLNLEDCSELSDKDPIQFSIILSNLNKSEYLERFIFTNYSFLPRNMIFEFNDVPKFPETKEKYKKYINIRNSEINN